jgi:hypothetical protein
MIDMYAIGRQRPSGAMTWTTIDIQGPVGNTTLGTNPLKGLAYNPLTRLFYTIAPNNPGGPQLCSVSATGNVQAVRQAGPNLTGGLVYRTAEDCFYAVSNGTDGLATFYRVPLAGPDSPLFAIAAQCTVNGLAHVRVTDTFYALVTKNDFTSLYSINLNGTVRQLFGAGLRVFGGLCHSPSEDLFYFVANEPDGFSRLWTLSLNGSTVNRMGLGQDFNNAAIITAPWFGGSLNVLSPLAGERFVVGEQVRLDANILGLGGPPVWNSDGVVWTSDRDGALGSGSPTVMLSEGNHVITASKERLKRTVNVRVFADLWRLYQSPPSPAEIDRVQRDFRFEWVDGTPGDPTRAWASYPGTPFDQTSANPSRTAVLAKLDVLRHQRFSQPLPFGTAATAYEHVRQNTHTVRVSLGDDLNQAGGGVINLNRTFTLWSNNPAQPNVATPYVDPLYLFMHESRHNEPGEPLHTSCTSWTGAAGTPNGMDSQFEPGSGYGRAAVYLMWVHKYGRFDPPAMREQARSDAMIHKDRFCTRPASTNPLVRALLQELWQV